MPNLRLYSTLSRFKRPASGTSSSGAPGAGTGPPACASGPGVGAPSGGGPPNPPGAGAPGVGALGAGLLGAGLPAPASGADTCWDKGGRSAGPADQSSCPHNGRRLCHTCQRDCRASGA